MKITYYTINHMLYRYGNSVPSIKKLEGYFNIFGQLVSPTDRTGQIRFPVRMASIFPLPEMRILTKSYGEICRERARELLRRECGCPEISVFWSGGIDSTCALVSLLEQANTYERERIVVYLSEGAIQEYPEFYRKHIRGKLRRKSSVMFPYILGDRTKILVNGELNDQIFGSDLIGRFMTFQGAASIGEKYDRRLCVACFALKLNGDEELALFYVKLFERLFETAPIPLKTNFDFLWWINFTLKWQTVYMRVLSYAAERNARLITPEYAHTYFAPFFETEDFQLWAMNNTDKRIRGTWNSYKWPAKEIIYEFTKDAEYRDNKRKNGSLQFIVPKQIPFSFIDESFRFYKDLPFEVFYEKDNDFM